jgi:hypothetical protein
MTALIGEKKKEQKPLHSFIFFCLFSKEPFHEGPGGGRQILGLTFSITGFSSSLSIGIFVL